MDDYTLLKCRPRPLSSPIIVRAGTEAAADDWTPATGQVVTVETADTGHRLEVHVEHVEDGLLIGRLLTIGPEPSVSMGTLERDDLVAVESASVQLVK